LCSVLRPHQHNTGYTGDGFYRSKDPTNSIKVLKEKTVKEKPKKHKENTNNTYAYTHTHNSIQIQQTRINTASPLVRVPTLFLEKNPGLFQDVQGPS